MPTRRVWRYKARVAPLTPMQWRFFLCKDVTEFDRLNTNEIDTTGEFFWLYWVDHWRECYAEHKEEIEAEWRRRGWTEKEKAFVMTPYRERGIVLARDREREERRQRRLENERKDADRDDAGHHGPAENRDLEPGEIGS